jgi:Tol biopolymer transport system component
VFATRRDGVGELYLVNDNGAGLIRLMTDRTDLEPAWSPDGSRIALRSNLPGSTGPGTNGEILLMNPDGSGLTNITNDPEAFDIMPAWAPGANSSSMRGSRWRPAPPSCTPSTLTALLGRA